MDPEQVAECALEHFKHSVDLPMLTGIQWNLSSWPKNCWYIWFSPKHLYVLIKYIW